MRIQKDVSLLVGRMVRVRTKGAEQHAVPARLVAVQGDRAFVRPPGHPHIEVVPASAVRRWLKGEAIEAAHAARRSP